MSGHWLTLHDSVDPSWWHPLERLATELRDRADLPPIDPDDYLYCARVRVGDNLPMLHVYRNVLSQRYLNIDEMAHTWRYVGGTPGYAMCELDEALQRADLRRAELLAGRTRRGSRRPSAAPLSSQPRPTPSPGGAGGVVDGAESPRFAPYLVDADGVETAVLASSVLDDAPTEGSGTTGEAIDARAAFAGDDDHDDEGAEDKQADEDDLDPDPGLDLHPDDDSDEASDGDLDPDSDGNLDSDGAARDEDREQVSV